MDEFEKFMETEAAQGLVVKAFEDLLLNDKISDETDAAMRRAMNEHLIKFMEEQLKK